MSINQLNSLEDIFTDVIFRVPDYQRGYAWTKQQVNDLWEDIVHLVETDDPTEVHYMGMVSVQKVAKEEIEKWKAEFPHVTFSEFIEFGGRKVRPLYVVDGQQRLTTLVLLISALQKVAHNKGGALSGEHIEKYLFFTQEAEQITLLGYEADVPSHKFLKQLIVGNNKDTNIPPEVATSYTHNLIFTKGYFEEELSKLNDTKLKNVFEAITKRLRFNFFEIPQELNIFTVFETMNYRGKSLSTLELLKNRLIYLVSIDTTLNARERIEQRSLVNNAWTHIYQVLGADERSSVSDEDYLRAHWLIYFDHVDRTGREFRSYKQNLLDEYFTRKSLNNGEIPIEILEAYIKSLRECAANFFHLRTPFKENSEISRSIRMWLQKIHRLYPKSYLEPLILAALVKLDRQEESKENVLKLLEYVERYLFIVFALGGMKANAGRREFYVYASEYMRGKVQLDYVIKKLRLHEEKGVKVKPESVDELLDRFRKDREKVRGADGFNSWKYLRYFLTEYECYLREEELSYEDARSFKLDLLFPPELDIPLRDKEKIESYKDYNEVRKKNWSNFTTRRAGQVYLAFSLGNFLMTRRTKNYDLQYDTKSFKNRKEDQLGSSKCLNMEEEVFKQAEEWTPAHILARGLRLISFMEKRWDIKFPENKKKEILGVDSLNIEDEELFEEIPTTEEQDLFSQKKESDKGGFII